MSSDPSPQFTDEELFGLGRAEQALPEITALVQQARDQQELVEEIEERLTREKEALRQLVEFRIPDALDAAGVSGMQLADGARIEVEPFYSATIKKENRDAAHAWFEERGEGGMIKSDLVVKFNRREQAQREDVRRYLQGHGFTVATNDQIPPPPLQDW